MMSPRTVGARFRPWRHPMTAPTRLEMIIRLTYHITGTADLPTKTRTRTATRPDHTLSPPTA